MNRSIPSQRTGPPLHRLGFGEESAGAIGPNRGSRAAGVLSRSTGFTLLEIVVALAILGMGMGAVMQIFSGGLKNIHRIDLAHRAMNHAENVMNDILSDEELVDSRDLSGDLDQEFAYTARVRPWEEPQSGLSLDVARPPVMLLSVQVDVHFKNDPRGKLYRAVCLKTVPSGAESPVGSSIDAIRQLFGGQR